MSDQPVAPTPDSLANLQTLSIEDVADERLRQGISASINLMENIN